MTKAVSAGILLLLAAGLVSVATGAREETEGSRGANRNAYHANILALARSNDAYRRVLFTGARTQLVAMTIPPGGDVGEETHERVEQTFVGVAGTGQMEIDGVPSPFSPGDVVVVPPGTRHNLVNTGSEPLRLYTIYVPPNHLPGRVQATKADAEADAADNEYGRQVEAGRAGAAP